MTGAAIAQQQPAPTPKRGGTAIVVMGSEPTVINPVISSNNPEKITGCMVNDALVTLNMTTSEFEPMLAESWVVSPDGKTYTFKLRKTEWHDGKPFTSEDVRYTFLEVGLKYGAAFASGAKVIETINTPDTQTVEIKLKEPFGPFLRLLTCTGGGGILAAHLFKGTDPLKNPANLKPIGTGAFKFAEWVAGDHVKLVRNEKYWDQGRPYLETVIARIMPNPASRTQALLSGEVDFVPWTYFRASDRKLAEANPNTKLELSGSQPSQLFAFFNLKRKPLDDVRVRNALLMATDRKYIFDHAFFGSGRPGSAPWATQIGWAADPAIDYDKSHPFDPEKAGRLLEAAGYKADANGVRLRFSVNYDGSVSERNQTALAMQAMWRRAGVELTLQPLDAAVLLPRVYKEADFDIAVVSYQSQGDPAIGVVTAYSTGSIGANFGNASGYSNPEVDALFAKAAQLTATSERGAVYRQILPTLMRDLPAVMLHENRSHDAASKKLQGAWGYAGTGAWERAWLDR